jgi:hypothetical protein
MIYDVRHTEGEQRWTFLIALAEVDIDRMLEGGMIRIRLESFGIPKPFGNRFYVLAMDTPGLLQMRKQGVKLPSEYGRMDCVSRGDLVRMKTYDERLSLPVDSNGIDVLLVGGDRWRD